jgi:hypothetical protein
MDEYSNHQRWSESFIQNIYIITFKLGLLPSEMVTLAQKAKARVPFLMVTIITSPFVTIIDGIPLVTISDGF